MEPNLDFHIHCIQITHYQVRKHIIFYRGNTLEELFLFLYSNLIEINYFPKNVLHVCISTKTLQQTIFQAS